MQHMKKTIYTYFFPIFLFVSCNYNTKEVEKNKNMYCENEVKLLNKFDSLPNINSKLYYILDSLDYKLSVIYDRNNCGKYLPFSIAFSFDSANTEKIALKYFYDCGRLGPTIMYLRNTCTILLNTKGQVLFEGRIIRLDSLERKLTSFYKEFEKDKGYYPESIAKSNIMIHWNRGVSESDFHSFISQVINAYIGFAREYSKTKYGKNICELSKDEIYDLSLKVPFNIEITKMEIIDIEE